MENYWEVWSEFRISPIGGASVESMEDVAPVMLKTKQNGGFVDYEWRVLLTVVFFGVTWYFFTFLRKWKRRKVFYYVLRISIRLFLVSVLQC